MQRVQTRFKDTTLAVSKTIHFKALGKQLEDRKVRLIAIATGRLIARLIVCATPCFVSAAEGTATSFNIQVTDPFPFLR